MPKFGNVSKQRLSGVHPSLVKIAHDVVQEFDVTVLPNGGLRSLGQQEELVAKGASKTMFSKHLAQDDGYGHALDLAPYPIDWDDRERFYYMAGLIKMAAAKHGVKIRQGCDWDMDGDFKDQHFDDLPHVELA